MAVALDIEIDDTSALAESVRELGTLLADRQMLHESMTMAAINGAPTPEGRMLTGIRQHITDAAKSRHTTAKKLGATPTGYLEGAAGGLENHATGEGASIVINQGAEIFLRTLGPVTVTPRDGHKWLAIPCHRASYGKSPLNFLGWLDFFIVKPGKLAAWALRSKYKQPNQHGINAALGLPSEKQQQRGASRITSAKKNSSSHSSGSSNKERRPIYFWGLPNVTLPQDRGLLPTDEQLYDLLDAGLNQYLAAIESELSDTTTTLV